MSRLRARVCAQRCRPTPLTGAWCQRSQAAAHCHRHHCCRSSQTLGTARGQAACRYRISLARLAQHASMVPVASPIKAEALRHPWSERDERAFFSGGLDNGKPRKQLRQLYRSGRSAQDALLVRDVEAGKWFRWSQFDTSNRERGRPNKNCCAAPQAACRHKFALSLPGFSYSSRLRALLACGALVVHVQHDNNEFYLPAIQDGKHIVLLRGKDSSATSCCPRWRAAARPCELGAHRCGRKTVCPALAVPRLHRELRRGAAHSVRQALSRPRGAPARLSTPQGRGCGSRRAAVTAGPRPLWLHRSSTDRFQRQSNRMARPPSRRR